MAEDNPSSDEERQSSDDQQSDHAVEDTNNDEDDDNTTFKDLGVVDVLCEACIELKWMKPSKIQKEALPVALQGKDIIGLAETGSGKTGAFAIPILQALLENPQRYFALILTPTRELAFQISEQFEALVGGMDMVAQSLMLSKKPHIIIATPGRLVMDEADRILNMDFEVEVDKILRVIPRERRTYLYSATMTKKVQKLQRASLQDPVKVEVSTKYQTVDKLMQYYVFIPVKYKMAGNSFIVFVATCANALRAALLLRNLGVAAVPLHGQMSQNKRLAALNKGLDIPHVDVVINLDIPLHSKDYIHRYDVELYQRIEQLIGKQLPLYKTEESEVMVLQERVAEAQRLTNIEMKELGDKRGGKGRKRGADSDDDTEEAAGVRRRIKGKGGKPNNKFGGNNKFSGKKRKR
ncbi:DEAD box ATP-dependent RNA helicase [Operophtera brumata]|uniref:DEAD box ATP-dependent RNA helicase n=1 Tax=Operophtera brumata TaxID=104452 RepID=A0A0L7KYV0_OPEBR|nr:DEAD box ATP-dependent RNA helicase [Operophtera brumata]